MAKPRVFVSSTYYDLKHIRASLSLFIDSLGYESILFEKGQIAFISDDPLDISCYSEAEAADIFVLIIGGRYGAPISTEPMNEKPNQYTTYNSITRKEYETANDNHIPTYILIEKGVYAEYQTYKRNKNNEDIEYAHVDSVNIFKLIDDIHKKPNNNPIFSFEKYNEIEDWLREQWAGLFKNFLIKQGNSKKLDSLQNQIKHLEALNSTLKIYLETLMLDNNADQKQDIIKQENKKIIGLSNLDKLKSNNFFRYLSDEINFTDKNIIQFIEALSKSTSISEFLSSLKNDTDIQISEEEYNLLMKFTNSKDRSFIHDLNSLREIFDLPIWKP
ncbi:DUF4062 domain-containing protein [Acinetobacter sp. ANC 4636]|uniref:DUF4062 domain-containing protein n=1 Tax=Acinetobacter sp. ANC 3791 TaxID=2529836 RepID=UPI0010409151|nr:DUF4062 domain-containing protein [Acinetobacter sp. ANC 3791]TCB84825.1 DUF4062 domain-containing protein [Acinetobacter sp. ANC 3791]